MFERDLKERFSHQRELTYDVQQLFQWMDHLVSLSFSFHTASSALPWLYSSSAVFLPAEVPLPERRPQPHEQCADKITFVCAARPLCACVSAPSHPPCLLQWHHRPSLPSLHMGNNVTALCVLCCYLSDGPASHPP